MKKGLQATPQRDAHNPLPGAPSRTRTYPLPLSDSDTSGTETEQIRAKPAQQSKLGTSAEWQLQQNQCTTEQNQYSFSRPKRVPEEYGFPDSLPEDLAQVVSRWNSLSSTVKTDILAKVRSV